MTATTIIPAALPEPAEPDQAATPAAASGDVPTGSPAELIEELEACLAAVRDGYGDPPAVPREYPELSAEAGGTWNP